MDLRTDPIHEWFHVIQNHFWNTQSIPLWRNITKRTSEAHQVAVEGTAEWARDLPIRFAWIKGSTHSSITADEQNGYFISRYSNWISGLSEGLFQATEEKMKPYNSVFFWKIFAQTVGGDENSLKAIKDFWDTYSSYWTRGEDNFIEAMGIRY